MRRRYARKAAEKGGAAAEARENEKRNSWKALAEKHKKEYKTPAIETSGRFGKEFSEVLKLVAGGIVSSGLLGSTAFYLTTVGSGWRKRRSTS